MVADGNEMEALRGTGSLLREIARFHVKAQREQVACCGTTAAQCHILTELDRSGPLPLTELGRRLGLHKGWISRGVASLVADGVLDRRVDPADGRVVVVALSRTGRQRVRALNRALDRQAVRVLGRLAPAERAMVHRALELVRTALREELLLAADVGAEPRASPREVS